MDLMQMLRLNLQFFSQDDTGGSNTDSVEESKEDIEDDNEDEQGADKHKAEKTFTQSELEEIIKQRLARAEKDKQEAIKEAEKLAKMNAEQKREYELEKAQKENEELKAKLNRYELGQEASKILAGLGIVANEEILAFVVREDAEKTNEAVKAFTSLVDRISDDKMREKLKGTPPKRNSSNQDGIKNPFSKEHFNLTEQGRLYKEDPELYKQLKAQAGL